MIVASATRAIADALESGRFKGDFAQAAGRWWGSIAARGLVRELHVPHRVRVVAIGGATLGGCCKTPLAIAWARREAETGARVALVGHGYRANARRARRIRSDDDAHEVGDEALVCARALNDVAEVVIAKSRQAAIDLAVARGADVIVLDGVAQISPRRADVAILVRDDEARSNACPPAGDLRAPLIALESICDRTLAISTNQKCTPSRGELRARAISVGAHTADGTFRSFEELAKMRLGLALAIARPERVRRMLEARGVRPAAVSYVGDHRGDRIRAVIDDHARRNADLDGWLITEKCAAFAKPTLHDTVPIYVIAHAIELLGALP